MVIDNELYLKVTGPLLNRTALYHVENPEMTVDAYERRELRTMDQNSLYFGVIVRGGMRIFKELTGEHWTDAEVHAYNMEHIFGVKPVLINKGSLSFTQLEPDVKLLTSNFEKLQWDTSLLEGIKPKSSKFTKAMFSALIELCIKYYSEIFHYTYYETANGHEFRKELYESFEATDKPA